MRLVNANSLSSIDPLRELIHKVNGQKTEQELDLYLAINLGTQVFDAWIVYDEDEITGMITVEMVDLTIGPKAFIPYLYAKSKEVRDLLFSRVEKWAKEKRLNKMVIYSNRHYKKYQDYGFELKRTVLEKDV